MPVCTSRAGLALRAVGANRQSRSCCRAATRTTKIGAIEIIYTGEGGRDYETGTHTTHQTLTKGNLALIYNQQTGVPVRVIRGARLPSPHAPPVGYRYDGLYRVIEYWCERGKSGWDVWRFRLRKIAD